MNDMNSETSDNGKLRGGWLLVLAAGLAMVFWQYRVPGLSMDGVTYMQIARNLLMGEGLGWQGLWASPGYSLLIAGGSALFGIGDLLRVVSLAGSPRSAPPMRLAVRTRCSVSMSTSPSRTAS